MLNFIPAVGGTATGTASSTASDNRDRLPGESPVAIEWEIAEITSAAEMMMAEQEQGGATILPAPPPAAAGPAGQPGRAGAGAAAGGTETLPGGAKPYVAGTTWVFDDDRYT